MLIDIRVYLSRLVIGLVLISTWTFIGDFQGVKLSMFLFGCCAFILFIRLSDRQVWGTRYLFCFQLIVMSILSINWISYLNPSHVYNVSSNSFIANNSKVEFLPSSAAPLATLNDLSYFSFLLGLLPVVVYYGYRHAEFTLIIKFIWYNSLILAVVGVIFKYSGSSKILGIFEPPFGTDRYFFSTFTYKNHWGCYLILSIGAMSYYCEEKNWKFSLRQSIVILLTIIFFCISSWLCGSRSCSILMSLVILVFVWRYIQRVDNNLKVNKYMLGLIGLVLLSSLTYVAFVSHPELSFEYVNSTRIYIEGYLSGDFGTRFYLSRDTWFMFIEKPVFGWGLGSYQFVFNYYNDGVFRGPGHLDDHHYVYAHNDILQNFAELGAVGTLFILVIMVYPIFGCRKSALWKPSSIWMLSVLIILLLYCLVEFPLRTPAVSLLFTILIAGLGAKIKAIKY